MGGKHGATTLTALRYVYNSQNKNTVQFLTERYYTEGALF